MTVIGEHTHVKIPTVSYGAEKTARRSLGFSGKENEQNLPYEGEVKVDSQTSCFNYMLIKIDIV